MGNFKEDLAKVKAFVFDVDGVLTDGGITPTPDGDFLRTYNAKDGYSISYAIKAGYHVAIITGGKGKNLEMRAKMLGVTDDYCPNCLQKLAMLDAFMKKYSLTADQVMMMGDDIPDIDPMMHVGMPVCPADAVPEVIEISRYVSQFPGGGGCVRDVVEQVLRSQGKWDKDQLAAAFLPSV